MADWLELGATLLGGLLGSKAGGDTTTSSTQTSDPWAPAQPYLLDNLKTNADLQKFYQQNPFNAQQKQSYENIYGDLNNFRNNTAPGLMDFANNAMTGSYSRQKGGAPGSGGGYGGSVQPGGMKQSGKGPFSVSPGTYAMPDWEAMNPFSAQNKPAAPAAPQNAAPQQTGGFGGLLGSNENRSNNGGPNFGGGSGDGFGFGSDNVYGIGSSFNTDAALSVANKASLLGIAPAAIAGLIAGIKEGYMSQEDIDREVASLDRALADKDARNHGMGNGPGFGGGFDSVGIGDSNVGDFGGPGWGGGS